MGTFALKTGKDNQFYFNLKAGNGQVILSSEGYTTQAARDNGIESVRKNSTNDDRYKRLEASDGKPYFTLTAANNQVIGKSELYESRSAMEKGIESVKKNAPDASIKEE